MYGSNSVTNSGKLMTNRGRKKAQKHKRESSEFSL